MHSTDLLKYYSSFALLNYYYPFIDSKNANFVLGVIQSFNLSIV